MRYHMWFGKERATGVLSPSTFPLRNIRHLSFNNIFLGLRQHTCIDIISLEIYPETRLPSSLFYESCSVRTDASHRQLQSIPLSPDTCRARARPTFRSNCLSSSFKMCVRERNLYPCSCIWTTTQECMEWSNTKPYRAPSRNAINVPIIML